MAKSRLRCGAAFLFFGVLPPVLLLASFAVVGREFSSLLGFAPGTASGVQVFAFLLGWVISILFMFSFGPLLSRAAFSSRRMSESEADTSVAEAFAVAGLPVPPSFWVSTLGATNAWIAGIGTQGQGLLPGPALHVSEGIRTKLSEPEFQAVLRHEVSHLKLGHLRERIVYGVIFSFLGLPALALAALFFGESVTLGQTQAALFGGLAWLLIFQWGMAWVSRAQELEADAWAVVELGAVPSALISAIGKLESPAARKQKGLQKLWATHPSLVKRTRAIEEISWKAWPSRLRRDSTSRIIKQATLAGVVLTSALLSFSWVQREVVRPELLRQAVSSGNFERAFALIHEGTSPSKVLPLAPSILISDVALAAGDREMSEVLAGVQSPSVTRKPARSSE